MKKGKVNDFSSIILRMFLILFSSLISGAYLLAFALHPAYKESLQPSAFPWACPVPFCQMMARGPCCVTCSQLQEAMWAPLKVLCPLGKTWRRPAFYLPVDKAKVGYRKFITLVDVFVV